MFSAFDLGGVTKLDIDDYSGKHFSRPAALTRTLKTTFI
jgi:hypothetical protein